jgi:cellulose synthase/poly-beta-1,6-N-acetylglucosamine synthase-like glycosyltransferase
MQLTVVIATRDRRAILFETLERLERQAGDARFEVIVVDDGSVDGTREALKELSGGLSYSVTLVEERGRGPAAARNRALAVASAPVCLFIDDDSWPREDLLIRHRDFHETHPEGEAALLGRIDLPTMPPPSPFMRWLAGIHIDSAGIEDVENAGGDHFFTGNVSAKTSFLKSVGGFDERFTDHEDIDLGLRLEEQGLRLFYDSGAAVEHYSPVDLPMAIARMRKAGGTLALLAERHKSVPVPRRPGIRHRVKAGVLTCLVATGVGAQRFQEETWRFLCHEALREAYWDAVDARERGEVPPPRELRIGGTLGRLASRHPDARLPA